MGGTVYECFEIHPKLGNYISNWRKFSASNFFSMNFLQLFLSHIFVNLEFKRAQMHKTNRVFYNCVQEFNFLHPFLAPDSLFQGLGTNCSPKKVKTIVRYGTVCFAHKTH